MYYIMTKNSYVCKYIAFSRFFETDGNREIGQ